MESNQVEMFKTAKQSGMMAHVRPVDDMNGNKNTDHIPITTMDHHIIEIVSTYIKKLPDTTTKKQLARIMINFIMKSANL